MQFVKYTCHTRDIVVLSAYCASLPMKRDQKFAFANSSSHGWFTVVERLKMAILIRERTWMLDFFGMYLLLRYKAIGLLKNFGERCQNSRFKANKYIWIGSEVRDCGKLIQSLKERGIQQMCCFVILLLFNEMQMSVRHFSAIPHLRVNWSHNGQQCVTFRFAY